MFSAAPKMPSIPKATLATNAAGPDQGVIIGCSRRLVDAQACFSAALRSLARVECALVLRQRLKRAQQLMACDYWPAAFPAPKKRLQTFLHAFAVRECLAGRTFRSFHSFA
jgi:hypothetical protein